MNNFEENREKSLHIVQFKCCRNSWWGTLANNTCNKCKRVVQPLALAKMIGIGWFECSCGRRYAGFSRGDVTSKCHSCNVENLPLFIVPGEKAAKDEPKNSHYCAVCEGSMNCPIVEEAQKRRSLHRRG